MIKDLRIFLLTMFIIILGVKEMEEQILALVAKWHGIINHVELKMNN